MNPASRKLLIIEDDQIIANIYKSKFEKAGFEVDIAYDGQAGFYRVHEYKPNAVLLDLMLPHMNGVDILKKIRAQKRFDRLPIVVFTNGYLSEFAQDAAVSGATHVFNKATTSPQQIIDAINASLYTTPHGTMASGATMVPTPTAASLAVPPIPSAPATLTAPTLAGLSDIARAQPVSTAPSTQATAAPLQAISTDGDAAFQAELLQDFLNRRDATLGLLRRLLQSCLKCDDENTRQTQWIEFYRKVHSLMGISAIVGLPAISRFCGAVAALIKELQEKPKNVNASTTQTIAQAVDFIGVLFNAASTPTPDTITDSSILVVDDEAISRRAVTYALEKAQLKSTVVEEPNEALKLLGEKSFDLIILDIDMPELSGLDLCTKLRELPAQKNTPVIFVTGLVDFEHRTKSKLSGGNDFIAKPFLFIELALKALLNVMRHRSPPGQA